MSSEISNITISEEPALRRRRLLQALRQAERKAAPIGLSEAMVELGRCLTLCAPSGMTQNDRAEWLTAALGEVGDIPAAAFAPACAEARRTCDHPSRIIPAIIAGSQAMTLFHKRATCNARDALAAFDAPRLPAPPEYVSYREIAELIKTLARPS